MGTRVRKEREMNKSFEQKHSIKSHQCENCLKKSKRVPDYDERHFCCEECRIEYRKLKIKVPFVGEHLISPRAGIVHHGIGDDQGGVLHYAGLSEGATSAPVLRSSFDDFRQGHKIVVQPHKNRKYSLLESVKRAEQRLGESNYDMHSNNCEHFVNWCVDGKVKSQQVEKIATYVTGVIVFTTVIVVFNLFAVTGFAAVGSSMLFPRLAELHGIWLIIIFSGLGIIGGLALITTLSFTILRDYIWLSSEERRSRRIARRSAVLTVFVTALVGFVYIYILSQQILVGDLLEKLDPGVVPKLVNISLFLATAFPAVVAISVGLLVHKILSRNISQV
jgi:Lecithin retinol acyltransferase